jgi:hypothetical protein
VHKERPPFLQTAFAANCVYDYAQYFDKEKTRRGALFYKSAFHEWVLLRGVQLSSLASFPQCERVMEHKRMFLDIIRASGTRLKTLQTDMDFEIVKEALFTHCTLLERLKCGMISNGDGLDTLLGSCPSLQHLSFQSMDAPAVEVLHRFGSQIRSLCMAAENDYELRSQWPELVPHLPNLTEVEIGNNCPLDAVLIAVGQHCPHLRTLKVTSYACSPALGSDAAMEALIHGCPNLERAYLGGGLSVSEGVLLELLHRCRKLVALCFDNGASVSGQFVSVLAREVPALRELRVTCRAVSSVTQHIASWPLLESLTVQGGIASDNLMHALVAHCPLLRCLVIAHSQQVTDAGVTALAKGCAQLQRLELHESSSVTIAALEAIITHCRYLEILTIE